HHAIAIANRIQLLVGKIAGGFADVPDIAVGGHNRSSRDLRQIPEALLVQVADIQHDTEQVTGADQLSAEIGHAWSRIRALIVAERHTVGKDIAAAPTRTDRAQAGIVIHL